VRRPGMRSADVKVGCVVEFEGRQWSVWARGPESGTFWLTKDGEVHPEPVHARHLTELLTPERRAVR